MDSPTRRALASWAFDELAQERIEVGYRINNPGFEAVAARAGCRPGGIERAKLEYEGIRDDAERCARLRTYPLPCVELLPLSVRPREPP